MKVGRMILFTALVFYVLTAAGISRQALREAWAMTCCQGINEKVPLVPTDRLPEAGGDARVERQGGTTHIDVEIDSMKPASLFGGDYNTYVLWAVPPMGPAENLGECILDGGRSRLHATTAATSFAILVTAEPHFFVSAPSAFVILQNKPNTQGRGIQYSVVEGVYNFERTSLEDRKQAKGTVHSEVRQALTAIRLAQRAGAEAFAKEEFGWAKAALDQTLNLGRQRVDKTEIARQARQTVRLAVAAQRFAESRAPRVRD
jgi:hypothetical protein